MRAGIDVTEENAVKIAVYGATGMVGSRVVAEAAARGIDVIAVSRSGRSVDGAKESVAAELGDTARLLELAADVDAVVVSVPTDRTGGSPQPVIDAHRGIIAAAPRTRLLVVGGAGSLEMGDGLLVDSAGFPDAYKGEARAFTEILADYRSAGDEVDWTLISPSPVIEPGERTGRLVLGTDSPVGDRVSAEDFAVAIVDELLTPAHRRARFTVASGA